MKATWVAVALAAVAACSGAKPDEERCALAVENIRRINNLKEEVGVKPETMIRSCRAHSSRESVECMIAAADQADLVKCEGDVGAEFYDKAQKREAQEAAEEKAKGDGK
jgi:hypothetical protein